MIYPEFKNKSANLKKLTDYGFNEINGAYHYKTRILDNQFEMSVNIVQNKEISTTIVDLSTGEPYTLHLIESANGSFVGRVRTEFENVLNSIAENCFEKDVFQSDQAHSVIKYVNEKYGDELEFLWEKFSSNAVWRRSDNKKWYGILLKLSKRKLGIDCDEIIDIIDFRADPKSIKDIVDNKTYFAGYHMNKKHWLTICLDGSVPTEEIYKFLDNSYILAK